MTLMADTTAVGTQRSSIHNSTNSSTGNCSNENNGGTTTTNINSNNNNNNNNNNNSSTTTTTSSNNNNNNNNSWYESHCVYLVPVLGWFLFSTLLASYNKKVFGKGELAFPCPLFMTSIHFWSQWLIAELACGFFPDSPWTAGSDRVSLMSWKEYMFTAIPCGLVTSADIGLSNLSWMTLTLTLYTMIKSSTPIFVVFWAQLFGIVQITKQLLAVIALITLGEYIIVVKGGGHNHQYDQDQQLNITDPGGGGSDILIGGNNEDTIDDSSHDEFNWNGIVLCLCASILSGARWTLVQLKIQSLQPPISSTIAIMRLLAPSMFISLFFTSLLLEKPWHTLAPLYLSTTGGMIRILLLALFGSAFAICMILCEFYLILHANAIVLTIGGVVKEVLTIFVGVLFFHDTFTPRMAFGCSIIFVGVVLYKFTFAKSKTHHHPMIGKEKIKRGGSEADDCDDGDEDDFDLCNDNEYNHNEYNHNHNEYNDNHNEYNNDTNKLSPMRREINSNNNATAVAASLLTTTTTLTNNANTSETRRLLVSSHHHHHHTTTTTTIPSTEMCNMAVV